MSTAPPRRVEGRKYFHPRAPGIVHQTGLFIPDHQRGKFPIVLPTCSTRWPMHRSTTDATDVVGRAQLPVIGTPESNINPFKILPTTETELCRFSKSAIGGKCSKSGNCRSTNFSPVANAANSGADSSVSDGTVQLPRHGM